VRLLAFALGVVLSSAPPAPLTVSAAISLTDAMEVLGPMYTKGAAAAIRFNYGGSNALARQIVRGAPVDVFISADEAQMDVVGGAGALAPGTRVKLLGNTMVVVRHRRRPWIGGGEALRDSQYRRIAIGDPEAVPAGVYAKRLLMQDGLWDILQPKLVPVGSVRAALAAVDNGGADAALVYASDAFSYRGSAIEVLKSWPPNAPGIVYPAAVLRSSRHLAEAARFLTFLCGADAAAVFERHRFNPLRCT
jgi:molybdate transport system substrate-binding protein